MTMKTSRRATTGRMTLGQAILFAVVSAGAGLLGASAGALAQTSQPRDAPPPGVGELPLAASPRGATYIPGVGFRFVPPLGSRVYGYYYGPRVYGYYDDREARRYHRARRVACDRHSHWFGERCARRWR
jgi:hypothetical protein